MCYCIIYLRVCEYKTYSKRKIIRWHWEFFFIFYVRLFMALFTYSRCTVCSSICTLMSFSVSLLSPVHITVFRALVDYPTSVCRVYSPWTSLHDTLVSPNSFHWHAHTHLSICRYDTEIVPNQLGPVRSCVRLPSGSAEEVVVITSQQISLSLHVVPYVCCQHPQHCSMSLWGP